MPDPSLGSRHRAAVGLTKESDAVVVVVSEETGLIRLSARGRLSRAYGPDELGDELERRLGVKRRAAEADQASPEDELEGLSDEPLDGSGVEPKPAAGSGDRAAASGSDSGAGA